MLTIVGVPRVLYATAVINVVGVNANGIRTKRKRLMLHRLLRELRAGVGIVSETHLRRAELGKLSFPDYYIRGECCRPTPPGERIGGGVLILVQRGIVTESVDKVPGLCGILEHCVIRLFPTEDPQTEMRLTGLYVSPSNTSQITMSMLEELGATRRGRCTGEDVPHLLIGDFNTTSWGQLFAEWVGKQGMQELVDPAIPTYALGSSIDKMLFLPGYYVPSSLLPPGSARLEDHAEKGVEPFFPAVVLDYPMFSDHSPVMVPISSDAKKGGGDGDRSFRVGNMGEEDWQDREKELSGVLAQRLPEGATGREKDFNTGHYYELVARAIREAFEGEYKKARNAADSDDPLERFLLAHTDHPQMEKLIAAMEGGQAQKCDAIISRMSGDDWKRYLQEVRLSDTRSIFAFLARSEGRQKSGFVPEDSAPLLNGQGEYVLNQVEETELLTAAVRERLSALAVLWRDTHLSEVLRLPFGPHERPLEPFRESVTAPFVDVTRMEVLKAIGGLTKGKAPGPDGLPTEIFKNISALVPALQVLLNAVYFKGKIPEVLCRVHVVLLKKPGKDPRQAGNRRPISLINTAMKILEGIIYNRIIHRVEPMLSPEQYAYRRARGTEHHLVSIMDLIHRALIGGQYVYLVSFDIAGAFDRVSHYGLTEELKLFGIDAHTRRLIHNWIRGRKFIVKHRTPRGTTMGRHTEITSGLPQGGVLSPVLWLMFFNGVGAELSELRRQRGEEEGTHHDYMFADDLTTVILAPNEPTLQRRAVANAGDVKQVMKKRFLDVQDEKTKNVVYKPEILQEGVYRRAPPLSVLATRTRLQRQYQTEARSGCPETEFELESEQAMASRLDMACQGYPFPLQETVKVLGVILDNHMTLDEHYRVLMSKAQVRQGILTRVARMTWGLDTGVLRVTHDALITSLLRYALIVVGSCLPDDLMNKLDTRVVNIASRKIAGLPYITRIESLHFIADTQSVRNLYRQHCGQFLHQVLVSTGSGVQRRVSREICAMLGVLTLEPVVRILPVDIAESFVADSSGTPASVLDRTRWMASSYQKPYDMTRVKKIESCFHAHAAVLRRTPGDRRGNYLFEDTHSWIDVGLQVLCYVGWRPECSQPQMANIRRLLPPNGLEAHYFPGEYPPQPRPRKDKQQVRDEGTGNRQTTEGAKINVVGSVVRVDEILATIVLVLEEERVQFCSGYVHGVSIKSEVPIYMQEAGVLHAIRAMKEWMLSRGQENVQWIEMRAGDALVNNRIREWMRVGRSAFESPAATGLMEEIRAFPQWLQVDIFARPFYRGRDDVEGDGEVVRDPQAELFLRLAEHFRSVVIPQQGEQWRLLLPRVPLTTNELKEIMAAKADADERRALDALAERGSTSAGIIKYLDLTRELIREAFAILRGERRLQVNLARILGAARYKILTQGKVYHVKCPHTFCYERDSFFHMLECYQLVESVEVGVDAVPFLVKMARITLVPGGTMRIPYMVEYYSTTRDETTHEERIEQEPGVVIDRNEDERMETVGQ